jgi:hypothetical protein
MELLEFIHTKRYTFDIDPNAKPVHSRPYPVPRIYLKTFKEELDHLVEIGVLATQQESEWASPSFITPQKDSRLCWISNLCQLNKVIRCKQYPLPIITDILRMHSGYKFFTKLDVSMQYYTFEFDEESQDLCTIVTPFGKYKYLRLPMGLKCSPDIAQAAMENVLSGIEDADVYIDDVGAFSDNWDHHAYFSRKLTKSQQNYTTMEKEMLSIIATLEEFRSMLLGANIHVFMDHKNLMFDTLKTQRVLRWHMKIEEFLPMLHYIEGPHNILADNLSRLHCLVTPA